jgi:endo-1,4-beta-xylanase
VLNQDRNLIVRDLSVTAPAAAGLTIVNPGTPLALQDAVFSAADSTIENYRKQDGQVTVVDSAGKPLANASVRLRLTKHAFNFGTAVAGVGEGNALMWPNPAAGSSAAAYQAALAANFNMVSPENTGKWAFSEAVRGVPTLSYLDAIYNFAAANKMRARFHTLLWGESQPEWVLALEKTAQGSDSKAAAAALASLKDAIQARTVYLAKDRGKKFIEMDGINEASAGHQPVFLNLFGYAGVAEIYRNAIIQLRASSSSARLYFNDYNILNYGPDNFGSWYVNFIRGVVDAGLTTADQTKLGVGIQYYNIGGIQHDPVRVYQTLANLGTLGLPISLTEFGVDSGQPGPAATILADTVRLVFGTDQATTFNTWGFWTPAMWVSGAAFYDANWNLTPVGKVWQQMTGLKNWNLAGVPSWTTDVTLTTTAAGTLNLRGFMGDYTVTTGRLSGALALKSGVAAYTVKVRR